MQDLIIPLPDNNIDLWIGKVRALQKEDSLHCVICALEILAELVDPHSQNLHPDDFEGTMRERSPSSPRSPLIPPTRWRSPTRESYPNISSSISRKHLPHTHSLVESITWPTTGGRLEAWSPSLALNPKSIYLQNEFNRLFPRVQITWCASQDSPSAVPPAGGLKAAMEGSAPPISSIKEVVKYLSATIVDFSRMFSQHRRRYSPTFKRWGCVIGILYFKKTGNEREFEDCGGHAYVLLPPTFPVRPRRRNPQSPWEPLQASNQWIWIDPANKDHFTETPGSNACLFPEVIMNLVKNFSGASLARFFMAVGAAPSIPFAQLGITCIDDHLYIPLWPVAIMSG